MVAKKKRKSSKKDDGEKGGGERIVQGSRTHYKGVLSVMYIIQVGCTSYSSNHIPMESIGEQLIAVLGNILDPNDGASTMTL